MAERKEREFRPLRQINRKVVGPLGWPYPVLNLIIAFFERLRERRAERLGLSVGELVETRMCRLSRRRMESYKCL